MLLFPRLLTALLPGLLLLACSKTRNLLMTPRINEPGVIKLYYDREGDLYPPEVHVSPHFFYLEHENRSLHKRKRSPEYATLESALTRYDSFSNAQLREKYSLYGTDSVRLYLRLQKQLQNLALQQIEASMTQLGNRNLVLLIHGFNTAQPDADYYSLRRTIMDRFSQPPTFVEIYWDGLTDMGDNPLTAGIWGQAQTNSAKVGLGIRYLLSRISAKTNITIITHSLGASVATHALFNPLKWSRSFQEKLEEEYQSTNIPTPRHEKIVLGMLAPAISGVNFFEDIGNTVPKNASLALQKIVIGYNHFDYAVTKGGLFPRSFGSTALGADAKNEVKKTLQVLQRKAPHVQTATVNFSYRLASGQDTLSRKQLRPLRQRKHGIMFYQRNPSFEKFLDEVFGNKN